MKTVTLCLLALTLLLVLSQTIISDTFAQPAGQSVISLEYNANLPYRFRLWDSSSTNVSIRIQLWILQKIDNVTLSFSVPEPSGLVAQVPGNSTLRIVYDSDMKPRLELTIPGVDLQALPTTANISFQATVKYVLGLAYFSVYPNPLRSVDVKGLTGFILTTRLSLNLPSYLLLTQGSPFPPATSDEGGTLVYEGDSSRQDPVVLYQSSVAVLLLAATAVILSTGPLAYGSLKRNKGRSSFSQIRRSLMEATARFTPFMTALRKLTRTNSVKGTILCMLVVSSLSLSLATAVGPYPRIHTLIFSNLGSSASILSQVQANYPQVDVSVYSWWGGTGLRNELVTFHVVDLIIILDPPVNQLSLESLSEFASSGTHLVVIDTFQNADFARLAISLYQASGQLRVLPIDGLSPLLSAIGLKKTPSLDLFSPSTQLWGSLVAFISILSILLVFLAAMLSVLVITQAGPSAQFGKVLKTIAWLLGPFAWVMLVYYVVSFILRVPLTLHAAPPDFPKSFAATGSLGLGGGSIPRMLGGSLGALTALSISHLQRKAVLNWRLFLPFAATTLLATLLPIIGPFVDQILLFGIQGEITPTMTPVVRLDNLLSFSTTLYFRIFAIPDISRGIFLYFLAGTAFLASSILRRNLRTLIVLAAVPLFGRGLARVGDLDIFTFLGTLSGAIVASIILAMVLLAVDRLTKPFGGNAVSESLFSERIQPVSQPDYFVGTGGYHSSRDSKSLDGAHASLDSCEVSDATPSITEGSCTELHLRLP